MSTLTDRFRDLHSGGTFLLPNPWDVGSARYLEHRGFAALATTSSGLAASLGRRDQTVTLDELLAHLEALTAAVSVPVNADSERCYGQDPAGVAAAVDLLASAGAAGCSIEDYDPATGAVDPVGLATERVAAAAGAARANGLVLTARVESHLYGGSDLDDTIARLVAYRDAGAEVVYAPGLASLDDIARVVTEVAVPVNVLALPAGPTLAELASVGVARVSTGAALTWAAYRGLAAAADELLDAGTFSFAGAAPSGREITASFT